MSEVAKLIQPMKDRAVKLVQMQYELPQFPNFALAVANEFQKWADKFAAALAADVAELRRQADEANECQDGLDVAADYLGSTE